jgi:hypothetical protein
VSRGWPIVAARHPGSADTAGKDIENGGAEAGEKEADVPKVDAAKAGAAPVKTDHGEQEVDFKTLTAEEAFQVLGVSLPALLALHQPPLVGAIIGRQLCCSTLAGTYSSKLHDWIHSEAAMRQSRACADSLHSCTVLSPAVLWRVRSRRRASPQRSMRSGSRSMGRTSCPRALATPSSCTWVTCGTRCRGPWRCASAAT